MDDGSNTVLMSLLQDLVMTWAKVAAVAEMVKADALRRAIPDADANLVMEYRSQVISIVLSRQVPLARRLTAMRALKP